ncbi:hypothetical protein LINPERPRIM_LOCUS36300, partial [Linum perenne]
HTQTLSSFPKNPYPQRAWFHHLDLSSVHHRHRRSKQNQRRQPHPATRVDGGLGSAVMTAFTFYMLRKSEKVLSLYLSGL